MDDINTIISKNLKRLMAEKGVQQKDVAEAIGVTPQALNIWVKGNGVPRMGKIQRLADYFGVQKTDIIEDKEVTEAYESLNAVDIIRNALKRTGYFSDDFTDDEIIEILKFAKFKLSERG